MNNRIDHEIITLFELDRKNPKLDDLAAKILSDRSFDFDIHEDKVIEQNKSKWNNEYYKDHIALLNTNFSKERLKHCLELREYFGEKPFKKKTFLMIFITISFIVLCIILLFTSNSSTDYNNKISLEDVNITNIENSDQNLSIESLNSNEKTQELNATVKDDNTTLKIGN